MVKTISELKLGFADASMYAQRANKQMLNDLFVKNEVHLAKLLSPSVYYLIGEKGTGKTAYAAYLSNNEYGNCKSLLKFIYATDYERFHELKKKHHFDVSGYSDIWKTILFVLIAKSIKEKEITSSNTRKIYKKLNQALDEYYNNAFSPEIVSALKITDQSELAAKLMNKHVEIGAESGETCEFSEHKLQMNLFYICKQFNDLFSKMKLDKDVILFIDGIDIRPEQIPYDEYLSCIKGLDNACWQLNTGLFANVKDTRGRIKVVLLLRPDIFKSLGLQNATNKLADNSVYLDWRTTYNEYKSSKLYSMANKLLDPSQPNVWEEYFKWKLPSSNDNREFDTAFMEFLKISLSRPRDIQTILSLITGIMIDEGKGSARCFDVKAYNSDRFQNDYSEYFLGSLSDQLSFYYSPQEFQHFRRFFDFFDKPSFTYEEYLVAYKKLIKHLEANMVKDKNLFGDEKAFLQSLYDNNVITAIDGDGEYFHFSYREKSPTNISPKVPVGENVSYRFHYGLYKKAKMGRYN